MAKILESDFRKALYKNLVDAGYNKTEAQKIVGTKYYDALKEDIIGTLKDVTNKIENNQLDVDVSKVVEIGTTVDELKKLSAILSEPSKEETNTKA